MKEIEAIIRTIPEVADWPELLAAFSRSREQPHPDWEIPLLVCQALRADRRIGHTSAAAIACMQISIMLVDDILDDDPRGEHLKQGVGPVANAALAFQAAAFRLIEYSEAPAAQKWAAAQSLSRLALATSYGQHLDVQNLSGEDAYWRVVEAKSTPFYAAAYQVAAILAGAGAAMSDGLQEIGALIGEMIQIEDDLQDAFQQPANADWFQGRNNLLILYATHADHAEKEAFLALLPAVDDAAQLEKAQQILITCGAVSYAAYHLIERFREAVQRLHKMGLPDPTPLQNMLDDYATTLLNLLQSGGMRVDRELLYN